MGKNILLVDNELDLIKAYKRSLKDYEITLAESGSKALEIIKNKSDEFAVVISDMRMPGMDGIELLSIVKERSPNTVRMMLTGHGDLQVAIEAINKGSIFRFMNKPIDPKVLEKAINDGIRQHRMIIAEKELLEKTLKGSIKVLTGILSDANPAVFSRTSRITKIANNIISDIGPPDDWKFRIAALLSQIGLITIPQNVHDKIYYNEEPTEKDLAMYNEHPKTAANLLKNIPRLENVADIIKNQMKNYSKYKEKAKSSKNYYNDLGAQILKAAIDYEQKIYNGFSKNHMIRIMRNKPDVYNPDIVDILRRNQFKSIEAKERRIEVKLNNLRCGMRLEQDIESKNDLMLASKGEEITTHLIKRLRNFNENFGVKQPIKVLVKRQ